MSYTIKSLNTASKAGSSIASGTITVNPNLSDAAIARIVARTWRCSTCGHQHEHGEPAELRKLAVDHKRACGGTV